MIFGWNPIKGRTIAGRNSLSLSLSLSLFYRKLFQNKPTGLNYKLRLRGNSTGKINTRDAAGRAPCGQLFANLRTEARNVRETQAR